MLVEWNRRTRYLGRQDNIIVAVGLEEISGFDREGKIEIGRSGIESIGKLNFFLLP